MLRRSILATSALTAVAAVAAAVGIAATGQPGGRAVPPGPATGAAPVSGQELLLAAATTALRQPEGSGTYWHVRLEAKDAAGRPKPSGSFETWADRTGTNWVRIARPGRSGAPTTGAPDRWGDRGFSLCGVYITFEQLQNLPATPEALKASITRTLTDSGADPASMERRVLYGLVALVSQVPAPSRVRAAAFRAIAAYPGVVRLDPADGGQALEVPVGGRDRARLVIDPEAAQIRGTDFLAFFNQTMQSADGSSWVVTAGWTDSLPG